MESRHEELDSPGLLNVYEIIVIEDEELDSAGVFNANQVIVIEDEESDSASVLHANEVIVIEDEVDMALHTPDDDGEDTASARIKLEC